MGSQLRRIQTIGDHLQQPKAFELHPGPVVVGAMVLDVQGKPGKNSKLMHGTTVPGKVQFSRGGVGRNVAECMATLGCVPFLISVLGADAAGDALFLHWKSLQLPTEGIKQSEHISTPVVSVVFDNGGEMSAAVADVAALEEHLTVDWLEINRGAIRAAPFILLDTNVSPQVLQHCCLMAAKSTTPVWLEPVSVAKSTRSTKFLHQITVVSPNQTELLAMSAALSASQGTTNRVVADIERGSLEEQFCFLRPHSEKILNAGVKFVVLTLGAHGVILSYKSSTSLSITSGNANRKLKDLFPLAPGFQEYQVPTKNGSQAQFVGKEPVIHLHFPALPARVSNLSGAGDCLVGGTIAALSCGRNMVESLALGMVAAKSAVESPQNVPSSFNVNMAKVDLTEVLKSIHMLKA